MFLKQSSCTTSASIASYKKIERDAQAIESGEAELDSRAEKVIDGFALNPQSIFSADKEGRFQIKLDQVITAMLTHAMEMGGEPSKHYVLSCIVTCEQRGYQETFPLLRDLGITWLTHFLFICETFQ
jgi:hypothetical protein